MPDNVTISPAGAVPFAADDIGGVLYRRVKVCHGVDGTSVDASATDPLPVTMIGGGASAGPSLPNVYRTVQAAGGGFIAVWTPAAGKRFRLQRYTIEWCGDGAAVTAGLRTLTWRDGFTDLPIAHNTYVGTGFLNWSTGWVDLGEGVLSSDTGNTLFMNLTAGMSPGYTRVTVAGREE